MDIDRDAWLSDLFGHDVFKISAGERGPFAREAIAEHQLKSLCGAARDRRLFYYARVPTARVDLVRGFNEAGFYVVDVNLTLSRAPVVLDGERNETSEAVTVHEVRPSERAAVLDIAESCFTHSRFHLDPEIGSGLADAIKRAWVASYIKKERGEKLLVAARDGRPAGFLAVLRPESGGAPCRVIDLIGVARAEQGRGVGRALVAHLIADASAAREAIRVGTQAANLRSLRFYEALGFRAAESAYVLHGHVKSAEYLP